MDLEDVGPVNFPTVKPAHMSDDVRGSYVRASANVTFALEEASITHDRSLEAAMVTASTHGMSLDKTPVEYLHSAIGELRLVEEEHDDEEFCSAVRTERERFQRIVSSL